MWFDAVTRSSPVRGTQRNRRDVSTRTGAARPEVRHTLCSVTKRPYRLGKRADAMEQTRRRIVEATVELHRELGPAGTTVSEIARRAGVGRLTVYSHFPDEAALFTACQGHWLAQHPPPDLAGAAELEEPRARARAVLERLYAYNRETADMTAKVVRDARSLPALAELLEAERDAEAELVELLARGWGARGARARRVRAAIALALDFHAWEALALRGGLSDREAAAVAADAIAAAAAIDLSARSSRAAPASRARG